MIGLILFAVLGALLLLIFLLVGLWDFPTAVVQSPAAGAVRQMVKLEGLTFTGEAVLLDDTDYRMLLANPGLRDTAKRLRRDRQELALLWIAMLLHDLKELRRFRQFLLRRGVPAGLGEEARISCAFVCSLFLLHAARLVIRLAGPFALRRTARRSRRLVELMSYAAALVLNRVPRTGWTDVEDSWAHAA
jgi:hypothetical protein